MRIPLQGSAERMKNQNISWSEVDALVHLVEHALYHTAGCIKETVQKFTVFKKVMTYFFWDGENAVTMPAVDELEGHCLSPFYRILGATGGTEPGMTAKRNKLKITATWTAIHGATKGGITTIDHLIYVFHDGWTWMKSILDFFIMIDE